MASLTGNLVAETYKALLKTIDNDILTASEKQITDGLGGGSNVFIDSQGFLRANKYKVTNGLATQFLKADGSLDTNTYLTSITGAQVITALGFTPVPTTRTITINGETHNLAADNTWTIGGTAAIWGNITGTLSNQTDLQIALNAKFDDPTGTISQYIRGDGSIANFPTISGGLPTGGTAGQILSKIDATDYNAQWIDNYATQTKNEVKLGATLAKGAAVYVSSANGTNMIVSAASNTTEATSSKTLGLLETGGATNALVKCVTFGLLAGLDTSAASAGDPVWLGVNGALIFGLANKPVAPAHLVYIGVVTRVQSNNGEIFVNVQNGFELNEIHDVLITSVANNQGLFYESSTGLWKNKSIATVLGYTPQAQLNGTGLVRMDGTTVSYDNNPYPSGSGSIGYISKWNTATGLGNSSIYESSGSIGLNTTNVNYSAYGRAFTGGSFSTSSFGYEIASAATANGGLLGGLAYILIANDASRKIGAKIESNVSGTTATNLGADLRFYVKPDNAALSEIARMTASGITFYSDLTATNITATSFIKSGGLSNQFLMADGSVTTYTNPVTGTGSAGYIPKWTTAANIGSSLIYDDGTSIGIAYSTPNKGGYGRTLTGAAFGSASFGFEAVGGTTTNGGLVGGLSFILSQNDSSRLVGAAIQSYLVGSTATNYGSSLRFYAKPDGGSLSEVMAMSSAGLRVYGTIIKDGGTSTQFLMADGSVTTLSGVVTGSGTTNYLPKWTSSSLLGNSIISDNGSIVSVAGNLQSSRFYNTFVNAGNNSRNSFQSFNLNEASLSAGWVAADFGDLGTTSNRVVLGSGFGNKAIIGGHSGLLDAWATLLINPGGGNVVIGGTTDAGYKLDVNGLGRFQSSLLLGNFNGESLKFQSLTSTGSTYQRFYNSAGTARGYLGLFWSGSADYMVLDAGSIEMNFGSSNKFTFTGAGFIGMGTSSPEQKLHVEGNIQIGNQDNLVWAYDNGNYYNFITNTYNQTDGLTFKSGSWTSNTDMICYSFETYIGGYQKRLVINQNGNIGIGSNSPIDKLHIAGGLTSTSLSVPTNTGIGSIQIGCNGTSGIIRTWNSSPITLSSYNYQSFEISGSERMRLLTNGNVLIGTTTDAGYKLNVLGQIAIGTGSFYGIFGSIAASWAGGTAYPTIYGSSADRWVMYINPHVSYTQNGVNGFTGSMTGATLRMASDPSATNYWDIGIGVCSVGADKFAIGRNAGQLLTLTNAGRVGINQLSPSTYLDINLGGGGSNGTSAIKIAGTGNYDSFEMGIFGSYDAMIRTYGNDIRYYAGHWRSIGAVATENHSHYWFTSKAGSSNWSVIKMSLDADANLAVAGNVTAVAFYESSDKRLKKLIESNHIIDGIEKLEAKLYEKNGKIELGYFAQDAELIMPYAVTKNADGFLNLSYREVHTAKIARLEQRVAELEKQLNVA